MKVFEWERLKFKTVVSEMKNYQAPFSDANSLGSPSVQRWSRNNGPQSQDPFPWKTYAHTSNTR